MEIRRSGLLAILFLAVLCGAASAGGGGHRWALLVGIDTYDRSDVTPLEFAVADVKAVAKTLETTAGFPADHVFLLTSDGKGDHAARRTNVAFRLDWLAERVRPEDTVVFFFSGHGIEMGDAAWLLTQEADPRSRSTLEESGLDAARLHQKLKALKAQHLLVFVDACRNDPCGGKGGGANVLGKGLSRDLSLVDRPMATGATDPVSATFFACSPGGRSYEWPDQRHGFFTQHLLLGLKGQAADGRGRVTTHSLMTYLSKAVPSSTERVLNMRQVPWIRAEGSGMDTWALAVGKGARPAGATAALNPPSGHPGAALSVTIAAPASGARTQKATAVLAATVTGDALQNVTVTVNGQAVRLAAGAVQKAAHGGAINAAVPLDVGENTIVVTAMSASGLPVQAAVAVERLRSAGDGSGAGPGAGASPSVQAVETNATRVDDLKVWSLVPGQSFGPFHKGMSYEEARTVLHGLWNLFKLKPFQENPDMLVYVKEGSTQPFFQLFFEKGCLKSFQVQDQFGDFAKAGITSPFGSMPDDVRRIYGAPKQTYGSGASGSWEYDGFEFYFFNGPSIHVWIK